MKAKRLLVMDVDGTLIEEEVIDLLGQKVGKGQQMAKITAVAMRGDLEFKAALEERVAYLKGLDIEEVKKIYKQLHLTKGAQELIQYAHAHQWKVGLVSGGFYEVLHPLVKKLKIDYVCANHLAIEKNILTGKTAGVIVDKTVKLEQVKRWAKENELGLDEVIALGDGANDIPMLQSVGTGVAFNAKPLVKASVSYVLDERDLMRVLEFLDN